MSIEYFISGGELRVEKKLFIREMLRPDSVMKHLLNYNLEDHGKTRSLKIDTSAANQVVINFNFVDNGLVRCSRFKIPGIFIIETITFHKSNDHTS